MPRGAFAKLMLWPSNALASNPSFLAGLTIPVGQKITLGSGATARGGNATLVAGTITVANTTVTANTLVLLTRKTIGGVAGNLSYTLSAGASFTINSDNVADTSVVTWFLLELV